MVLVTGASGYVGGRLASLLHRRGYSTRCMARRPESLSGHFPEDVGVVQGDVLDEDSLGPALEGIETAFYLVHSMGAQGDFEAKDRRGAENFARAARRAGVKRIVYLGALANQDEELSAHLRSRHEVGDALRSGGPEVIELRASIVIGSGSLSFEMIRALVERLPVMITPRWMDVLAQPIGIEDLLQYLADSIELPGHESRTFEIGGAERVSYGDLMNEYARQRGLRRWMLRVPVLTPRLSSLWLGLVTPLYARIGRKLIESILHETVVRDGAALEAYQIRPDTVSVAIARALANEDLESIETRWSDALSAAGEPRVWAGVRFGNRLVDSRSMRVPLPPAQAFVPIQRIGGESGWYAYDWLWNLRGFLDLLVGGVGVRRGRPHPHELRVGDAVDFWRVAAFEPGSRLVLSAEMKLPGRGWLEFEVRPDGEGGSIVRQTAVFDPIGLTGLAYWYGIYPLHGTIFKKMLTVIGERAAEAAREVTPHPA